MEMIERETKENGGTRGKEIMDVMEEDTEGKC